MPGTWSRPLVFVAALLVATACTSGDSDDSGAPNDEAAATAQTVEVPTARLTPFCQSMIDLADELDDDPPDDIEQAIIDAYEAISPEVPDIIRDDFDAVLAELRGEPITDSNVDATSTSTSTSGPTPTSSTLPDIPPVTDETGATVPVGDAFFDEGRLPGETPSERVNAYVDFVCRGNQNNPGPPATQPLSAAPTSEP